MNRVLSGSAPSLTVIYDILPGPCSLVLTEGLTPIIYSECFIFSGSFSSNKIPLNPVSKADLWGRKSQHKCQGVNNNR